MIPLFISLGFVSSKLKNYCQENLSIATYYLTLFKRFNASRYLIFFVTLIEFLDEGDDDENDHEDECLITRARCIHRKHCLPNSSNTYTIIRLFIRSFGTAELA